MPRPGPATRPLHPGPGALGLADAPTLHGAGGEQRTYELFAACMGLPAPERADYLTRACVGDETLRAGVEELLARGSLETDLAPPAIDARALADPESAPASPTRLGPYRITGVLGRGGMGVVYRGVHVKTRRGAAIKTAIAASGGQLACLRREIHALRRLRHPGIVPVLDDGVEEGVPWFAMELMRGRSLADQRRGPGVGRRRWTPRGLARPLTLVRRMCAPLAYLHGEGIVHGDLKPANVLVRRGSVPVLVDFGLATMFPAASREQLDTSPSGGTLAYAAPEQLRGVPFDARADLHALGCILYELLTGVATFPGASPQRILAARSSGEAPAPPSTRVGGLPPGVDELLARLLAPDPRARLGHVEDVADWLEELGAEASAMPVRRTIFYRSSLQGRDALVDELVASLGTARFTLLTGDSGSGKTRLLVALSSVAQGDGRLVLSGEGAPTGLAPLGALRPALRRLVDHCAGGGAHASELFATSGPVLAPFEPAVAQLLGIREGPPALPPALERRRLHAALRQTFERAGGAVLLLDDLQWFDDTSLQFVLSLAERPGRIPVVAACRAEEMPPAVASMAHAPGVEVATVAPLSDSGVSAMLHDILAAESIPADVVASVASRSEGNPFFVAEHLRAAMEAGVLVRDRRGRYAFGSTAAVGALDVPGSIRELLESRFARLPAGAARLAEVASVLGRNVGQELLHAMSDLLEEEALSATHALLVARILEESAPGVLRFCHDRLRESAYARTGEERRRSLHGRAAGLLGAASDPDRMAEIGRHWELAGEPGPAKAAYLGAARRASELHAQEDAARWCSAYLALVREPTAESIRVRMELAGGALSRRGRMQEALAQTEAGIGEAQALGERAVEVRLERLRARVLRLTGRVVESEETMRKAMDLAAALGDRELEAALASDVAILRSEQGRLDEAHELFEQTLAIGREIGNERIQCVALGGMANVHLSRGEMDLARQLTVDTLAIAQGSGDRMQAATLRCNLGTIASHQERWDEAAAAFGEALGAVREIGDRRLEGHVMSGLAEVERERGRPHAALELFSGALAAEREVGDRRLQGSISGNIADLHHSMAGSGEAALAEAERWAREAEALLEGVGDRDVLGRALCTRGRVMLARGEEPRPLLERARAIAAEMRSAPESLLSRSIDRLERAMQRRDAGEPAGPRIRGAGSGRGAPSR